MSIYLCIRLVPVRITLGRDEEYINQEQFLWESSISKGCVDHLNK